MKKSIYLLPLLAVMACKQEVIQQGINNPQFLISSSNPLDSVGIVHNQLLDEFSPYLESISSFNDLTTIGEPILNIGSEYQICNENMQIIGSAYRNYGMSYFSEMVDSLSSNNYIGEQAREDLLDSAELLEAKFNYIQENGSYLSSGQLDSLYDFIDDALLELENNFLP